MFTTQNWELALNIDKCAVCRFRRNITAELGRAPAVVKDTLQVNGRTEFSGSRPAKTTAGIKMKCGIIDYVGGGTPHANVGSSRITGGVLPYG